MPGPLPLTSPTIAWRLEAGGPLHTSPSITGRHYLPGQHQGRTVGRLDLKTGAVRWRDPDLDGALTSLTLT